MKINGQEQVIGVGWRTIEPNGKCCGSSNDCAKVCCACGNGDAFATHVCADGQCVAGASACTCAEHADQLHVLCQ